MQADFGPIHLCFATFFRHDAAMSISIAHPVALAKPRTAPAAAKDMRDCSPNPNNSSDRPKSAQATKHLGQRFHCKKLHQTAHSHSCERYQRLGFDRAFLVNNAG